MTVDPVLGDDGSFYGPMDNGMVNGMRTLVTRANLITPNYTEACFLLDRPYKESIELPEAREITRLLADRGPDKVVVTSLPLTKGSNTVLGYEKKYDRLWKVETDHIPVSYPGTGDMFASVITGRLLLGDSLPAAMDRAVHFVYPCYQKHFRTQHPPEGGSSDGEVTLSADVSGKYESLRTA